MPHFPTLLRVFLLAPWLWWLTQPGPDAPVPAPMIDYKTEWRKADSLMARGLPKSALEIADRLYTEAKKTNNQTQLLKAAMRRVVFRTQAAKEEETYVTLTRELNADIAETAGATRAVLQSVLANVYWQFYQNNRNRFLNRTSTASPTADVADPDSTDISTDPRTWDTRRLMQTITTLYRESVKPVALRQLGVGTYDDLLTTSNAEGRKLRPTLYDVLAHQAIGFFANTEADVTKPIQAFNPNDPAYLGDVDTFVDKSIPATDTLSGKYQAMVLYQELLRFHRADKDPLALAVADIDRLLFAKQAGTLADERDLLEKTLQKQMARYKGQPAEAEYMLTLVQQLAQPDGVIRNYYRGNSDYVPNQANDDNPDTTRRWDRKTAAELARDLIARHPNTYSAQQVRPLLDNLYRPTLMVQTEEVNEPDKPFRARVDFQNTKTLFYKILRLTPDELLRLNDIDYNNDPKRDRWYAVLQKHKVVAQGQQSLPDDGDLRAHSTEIPMGGLLVGHYVLLVSNEGRFAKPSEATTEIVGVGKVIVSKLAYVMSNNYRYDAANSTLMVLDRQSGMPLADVSATIMREQTQAEYAAMDTRKTDAQGRVAFIRSQFPARQSYRIRFVSGDDVLFTDAFYTNDRQQPVGEPDHDRAVLFTDRAIYRPGQAIQFKVLLYSGKDNDYAVKASASATVRFTDVNGEEVGKLSLKTNEFGTATGTFTAPVGRLTGQMSLVVDGFEGGETSVRVEEYKRPTFAVVADSMKQAPTLGQAVTIRAMAKTLAGAAVDGAGVTYRVTRTYVQPYWYGWWRSVRPNTSPEQEIANGTATTNPDGTVSLTFVAAPDASIAASEKPRFTFTFTIDVTDRSGETRSTTQTLSIGYTALAAGLTLPDPVLTTDKTPYAVKLTNASGVSIPLKSGTVNLLRLVPPRNGALLRNRLWGKPDRFAMTGADFEKQFPLDVYADENNPATWAKTPVRAEPANAVSLTGLTPGLYEASIQAADADGKTATQTVFFTVIDPQQPTAPVRPGTFVQAMKTTAQPGEEAVFWVGTRQAGYVLMAVEEAGKVVRQEWIQAIDRPVRVALPVQEIHRGGFSVHFAMVQNGRLLTEDANIAVPFTNKQLTVETETFRDKLTPGQAEQWTLRVSGPNRDKVLAEMAATLYDASLDQFVPHDWATQIYQDRYGFGQYWQSDLFGTAATQRFWYGQGRRNQPYPNDIQRDFPMISWGPYHYDPYSGRFTVMHAEPAQITVEYQNGVATGRVVGQQSGLAIPGINVMLKGTNLGANVGADGSFKVIIPASQKKPVLIFSAIGYVQTVVSLNKTKAVTALMQENRQVLNEVVVVGYAKSMRKAETGAVAVRGRNSADAAMPVAAMPKAEEMRVAGEPDQDSPEQGRPGQRGNAIAPPVIRTNFSETAFFFPQLQTDAQGRVVLKFTMPDALTTWKLLTFAHTKTMQTGSMMATVQTQKDLMVTTNVPRFLRENDTLRLTARLDNLSGKDLAGTALLTITDALTGEPLTTKMGLRVPDLAFTAKAGQSSVAAWNLVVPEGLPPVAFRVTARAGKFTDGEERVVPVLPNRVLVTDVQPFWVDGHTPSGGDKTKTFRLGPLASRNPELPTHTERYTVEVTSNPAWYALQTLPYLMEYPYECAEQLFSRLYANALGVHILNSRPAFRQVVDGWKQTPPTSLMAKNDELKTVVLENTLWLADAKSESERTARLGQFFDQNNLAAQQRQAIAKLRQMQTDGGGLMWFSGMRPNLYMTLHVLAGLGHLQKLGVTLETDVQADAQAFQTNALRFIDAEAQRMMAEEKRNRSTGSSYWGASYLYARSFYLNARPVPSELQAYLLPALKRNWQRGEIQEQALAAVTLYRYGQKTDALTILQSLTERSKLSDELGLYWPDNVSGTRWNQAPVETQAYLIEAYMEAGTSATATPTNDAFAWYRKQPAFAKTAGNEVFIDKMRQWLVQQKRTQSWASTKATTEAVYALLLTGSDWLDTKNTVTVRVGGKDLVQWADSRTSKTEALTGYQKVTFSPTDVTPQLGVIEVSRATGRAAAKTGISWGAAYWQHFEPMDAVSRSGPGNLNVKKTLFRQRNSNAGPVLEPITPQSPLKPGDLLTVRVVLTTDRVMEYVHLKDGRASGFEPVTVLSGIKYQNGLSYYEAPRDASTDFFIDYLPVGTHVFEYRLRVVHGGDFGTGVATVQCFYAPEFTAHSAGGRVQVK